VDGQTCEKIKTMTSTNTFPIPLYGVSQKRKTEDADFSESRKQIRLEKNPFQNILDHFELPEYSLDLFTKCGAYISGSVALACATGDPIHIESDLDIFINSPLDHKYYRLVNFLNTIGYIRQESLGDDSYEDMGEMELRKSFDLITFVKNSSGREIQIIRLETSIPEYIVENFYSLHVMNWIFNDQLFVHSPENVRLRKITLGKGYRGGRANIAIGKYLRRGFTIDQTFENFYLVLRMMFPHVLGRRVKISKRVKTILSEIQMMGFNINENEFLAAVEGGKFQGTIVKNNNEFYLVL